MIERKLLRHVSDRVHRLPPLVRAIFVVWMLLGVFVAFVPELQANVPPAALLIFCAPAIAAWLLIVAWLVLRWMRRLAAPFLWLAGKVHGDG